MRLLIEIEFFLHRSLRKFESLDKYVEKVKELSDAFNQDSKIYKSNQINDLNEQNESMLLI
jgi:hypothetical protein